jgi:hypothetical protein
MHWREARVEAVQAEWHQPKRKKKRGGAAEE